MKTIMTILSCSGPVYSVVINPQHVPRKGEQINVGSDMVEVKNVSYDFLRSDETMIYVRVAKIKDYVWTLVHK